MKTDIFDTDITCVFLADLGKLWFLLTEWVQPKNRNSLQLTCLCFYVW